MNILQKKNGLFTGPKYNIGSHIGFSSYVSLVSFILEQFLVFVFRDFNRLDDEVILVSVCLIEISAY